MATTVDNPTTPLIPVLIMPGPLKEYANHADARSNNLPEYSFYIMKGSGLMTQLRPDT